MRLGIVSVGLLAMVYACGGDAGSAPSGSANGGDGGDNDHGGNAQAAGSSSKGGTSGATGGKPTAAGKSSGDAGEPAGGAPSEPEGGTASGAGSAGEQQAGDGGAAGTGTGSLQDNPVVPAKTKFLDYGVLRIGFVSPVEAATLSISLTTGTAAKLRVAEVKQVDGTTVDALLLDYHLPRDYALGVTGDLQGGAPFQTSATLPGLDNGSRVAFLTKNTGEGDIMNWEAASADALTPRDAADGICQDEADAAGLVGKFAAFLSEQGQYDAGCRAFGLDGLLVNKCGEQAAPVDDAPWLGLNGLPIVNGANNIASSSWLNAFSFYADGTRSEQVGVWTGTTEGGKAQTGAPSPTSSDCAGWTKNTNWAETAEFIGEYLLRYGAFGSGCGTNHGLLCLQVGDGFFGPSDLHEVAGKRAFISSTHFNGKIAFDGKTGIDAADALCQSEASGASYANAAKFHAYLSTAQTDAVCHILGQTGKVGAKCGLAALPDTAPWRRADNYPIGTALQLAQSNLTAPIAFAANGSAQFEERPWTGTNSEGNVTTTCGDWSVNDTGTGASGYASALTNGWSFFTDSPCSSSEPVYCFEN